MRPGQSVKLVRVLGAASPLLRSFRGAVGTVETVRERSGTTVLQVRFPRGPDGETFWVSEKEIEVVEERA